MRPIVQQRRRACRALVVPDLVAKVGHDELVNSCARSSRPNLNAALQNTSRKNVRMPDRGLCWRPLYSNTPRHATGPDRYKEVPAVGYRPARHKQTIFTNCPAVFAAWQEGEREITLVAHRTAPIRRPWAFAAPTGLVAGARHAPARASSQPAHTKPNGESFYSTVTCFREELRLSPCSLGAYSCR
jgi:hypothetical protein